MERLQAFMVNKDAMDEIYKKLHPLNQALNILINKDIELNDNLDCCERSFIINKLKDGQSEEEKKLVQEYRDKVAEQFRNSSYGVVPQKAFDPEVDRFRLISYEKNDKGQMRFMVSCIKNECYVNGMTLLDTHYTSWFDVNELNN